MTAVATTRLFLALWPTPAVRSSLVAWRDAAWRWPPGAALVAPERLHVTLHFIGAVPNGRVAEVADALEAVDAARFELRFGTPELWPHGIAVVRPMATPPALIDLQARLDAALRALGLPTEARPYRAHVTFARKAAGASFASTSSPSPPAAAIPTVRWRVTGFALVESRLGASGGYVVLRRYR